MESLICLCESVDLRCIFCVLFPVVRMGDLISRREFASQKTQKMVEGPLEDQEPEGVFLVNERLLCKSVDGEESCFPVVINEGVVCECVDGFIQPGGRGQPQCLSPCSDVGAGLTSQGFCRMKPNRSRI